MAKDNPRARRLGEQIQRELGDLLRRDVKDERIGNVTITAVSVTGDLRTARVYYLVFGKDGPDPKVQRGLESAAGFLRNALSRSLMIRYTPTLTFELDTSIEHGVRLSQLIDSVNKPEKHGLNDTDATHSAAPATGDPTGADSSSATDSADADDGHVIDECDYVDPRPKGE
jgi:ribosome-binding factor A